VITTFLVQKHTDIHMHSQRHFHANSTRWMYDTSRLD